ncbi:hypothetical protein [Streptomyces populi]|uniref:hypothetical protein n=1 Tax=Streptomyces populi TaxID=2058924 RepID=UPI001F0BF3CE|nr:hypothetical protein [Streptomyces populi]
MTFQNPNPQHGGPQNAFGLGTPAAPGQSARPRRRWLKYGAVALVSLFVGVGIGTSDGSAETGKGASGTKAAPRPTVTVTKTAAAADPEPAPTVTKTVAAKPKKTKEAGPATTFSGEGEYVVGEDIEAGTYKTAGSDGAFGCYWERAKDASGEFGSIIANNNLEGPGRVTLNKGEYFKTNRCQEWKKVG